MYYVQLSLDLFTCFYSRSWSRAVHSNGIPSDTPVSLYTLTTTSSMSNQNSPQHKNSEILDMTKADGEAKDKEGELVALNYDVATSRGESAVKVILLGDSAVGKSKLVERFLLDGYAPQQLSTYALTLYR